MTRKAFTLIELLIVVAIIAILAAIAVPNFLEAQTRAKVSRTVADMRTISVAIEAYAVDNNKYPREYHAAWGDPPVTFAGRTEQAFGITGPWFSTPIAYITQALNKDPFSVESDISSDYFYRYQEFETRLDQTRGPNFSVDFASAALDFYGGWRLISQGPDGSFAHPAPTGGVTNSAQMVYDPTNGTTSDGNIIRSQKRAGTEMPPTGFPPGLIGDH